MFKEILFDPKKSKIGNFGKREYYCTEYVLSNGELLKMYFEKFSDKKITLKCSINTRAILYVFLNKAINDFYYYSADIERYVKRKINSSDLKYQLSHIYQNDLARKGNSKDASFRIYFNWETDER